MITILLIALAVIAVGVTAVLIYRNNQKKILADAAKVSKIIATAKTSTAQAVADVKADAASVEVDASKVAAEAKKL